MAAGQNAALAEKPPTGSEGVDPRHPATGVTKIIDADAGRIEFLKADGVTPIRKIALCGFASSSRDMAPWGDPEWAIVGMNQLNRHVPRASAWFEIHKEWNTAVVPGTDHEGWLRDCGIPVLMTDRVPGLPTSVRFPIERLIAKFNDYFTSTVAHMLAWAVDYVDERVEAEMRAAPGNGLASAWDVAQLQRSFYRAWTIGIYGVDLVVGEEYTHQRPCAEYHLGQALARDIEVAMPKSSALLKARYRYGYAMEPDDLIKASDLEKRRVALVNRQQELTNQLHMTIGATEEAKFWQELHQLRERGADVGP